LVACAEWRALAGKTEVWPFAGAVGLFALSDVGVAISLWPMIAPPHVTLWQAASSPSAQAFLPIGARFLPPIILMCASWSYWVFRGKVRGDVGYH
jgi:cytochrome d ubiquinol oxidase subunit II